MLSDKRNAAIGSPQPQTEPSSPPSTFSFSSLFTRGHLPSLVTAWVWMLRVDPDPQMPKCTLQVNPRAPPSAVWVPLVILFSLVAYTATTPSEIHSSAKQERQELTWDMSRAVLSHSFFELGCHSFGPRCFEASLDLPGAPRYSAYGDLCWSGREDSSVAASATELHPSNTLQPPQECLLRREMVARPCLFPTHHQLTAAPDRLTSDESSTPPKIQQDEMNSFPLRRNVSLCSKISPLSSVPGLQAFDCPTLV